MKTIIIVLFATCMAMVTTAQTKLYPYVFSSYTEPYQNLSNATDLFNGAKVDDSLAILPLGFDFKWAYSDLILDTFLLQTNGYIYTKTTDTFLDGLPNHGMVPFAADLADRAINDSVAPALSKISYQTTGTVGDRICKVEWKNIGFYFDSTHIDFANFQVWIYEKYNRIEFRYGTHSINDLELNFETFNGPHIGLDYKTRVQISNQLYAIDSCSYVVGDSTNFKDSFRTKSIFPFSSGFPGQYFFNGLPKPNQVFVYMPAAPASIGAVDVFADANVLPTVIDASVTVLCNQTNYSISIANMFGKELLHKTNCSGNQHLNNLELASGIFLVSLQTKAGTKVFKVLKQ
jgi:hypothetical protein